MFDWFTNPDPSDDFTLLNEGVHVVKLLPPREEQRGNYDALIFPFSVNGNANIVPHEIALLYPRDLYDTNGQNRSKKILAKFYRCFGVDPKGSNPKPADFVNRTGKVKIARNTSGYLSVVDFIAADQIAPIHRD